jgi:hypothetical protein
VAWGKSTLVRPVAREYANAGWAVKIADLDVSQGTSFNWQCRLQSEIEAVMQVERFGSLEQAVQACSSSTFSSSTGRETKRHLEQNKSARIMPRPRKTPAAYLS